MKYLILIIMFLPSISAAETAEDIAWEIVNINDDFTHFKKTMGATLADSREHFISIFESHLVSPDASPEIIAQQEQLYLDAKNSSVSILDFDKLQRAIIADFVENFTYAELNEIREVFKKPIFKKIQVLSESLDKRTTTYIRQWEEENSKMMQEFSNRLESLRVAIKNESEQ